MDENNTVTTERSNPIRSNEECIAKYSNFEHKPGSSYCDAAYDGYLCWQPTEAGETAFQQCPPFNYLIDTTHYAFRVCNESGMWVGKNFNESTAKGWTNYSMCFVSEARRLLRQVDGDVDAEQKFTIAQNTRYLELFGFTLSLVTLVASLFIFWYFKSLRNNRTRIHKSLFTAMIVQVVIRLTVYIDQAYVRNAQITATQGTGAKYGIENTPYLCEAAYVLLEYAITVMFKWMFIEGLYLHGVVTANVLREKISYPLFYALGWGLPAIITGIWAALNAVYYYKQKVRTCWYGYNFSPLYWILQGPRLTIVVLNFLFLLNIVRVLVTKLTANATSELEKVQKAVRAAIVLLPLLGITNILGMFEGPLNGSVWNFALWCYTTHFLRSFQGFFIAVFYCFFNGEVRQVFRRRYDNQMALRNTRLRRPQDSLYCRGVKRRYKARRRDRLQVVDETPMSELNRNRVVFLNAPAPVNDNGTEGGQDNRMHVAMSSNDDGQTGEITIRMDET